MNVVIIGAGIVGLTSAYALLREGHQVTVIDRHAEPARGASQANGGFLSPSHCAPWAAPGVPTAAIRAQLDPCAPMRLRPDFTIAQARWLWRMLGECKPAHFERNRQRMLALGRYSRQCHDAFERQLGLTYERRTTGVLQLSQAAASKAAMLRQVPNLQSQGVKAVWRTPQQVFDLEPSLRGSAPDLQGALHVVDEGSGRCERFSQQLTKYLADQGVRFHWNTEVQGLDIAKGPAPKLRGVRLDKDSLGADVCVVATGPQAPRLLAPHLQLPVCPVKGYSMTARIKDPERAPRHAVVDERSKLAIVCFDKEVRVAGFADVVGHNTQLDSDRCRQLAAGFEALYPGVADISDAQFWAGLRPMTPDGPPVIGATNVQGLFLNTGHGTYGWTLSFGSAQLLADIVCGRTTALPEADYAIARYRS